MQEVTGANLGAKTMVVLFAEVIYRLFPGGSSLARSWKRDLCCVHALVSNIRIRVRGIQPQGICRLSGERHSLDGICTQKSFLLSLFALLHRSAHVIYLIYSFN